MAGAGILAAISAGAGIAGEAMQAHEEGQAEKQQQQALQLQEQQAKAKSSQDQISRDKQEQQAQSSQKARAVASGMSLSSGTYQSLSDASYNAFAQDTNIANINLSYQESEIQEKMDAAQSQYHTQLWGNLISSVGDAANMVSFGKSSPSGKTSSNDEPNDDFNKKIDQTYMSPKGDYDYYLKHSVEWY